MTKLKRPERYVQFESIKPELKEITEFYTRKVTDYQYRLKQLNEYADELENEISVLKEKPKVEVSLDNVVKPLVVVPQLVADYIETQKGNDLDRVGTLVYGNHEADDRSEKHSELHKWIIDNFDTFLEAIVIGYTVEKEKKYYLKHIDASRTDEYVDWLMIKVQDGSIDHWAVKKGEEPVPPSCKFTQSEIDKLNIGSYEQIEVEP